MMSEAVWIGYSTTVRWVVHDGVWTGHRGIVDKNLRNLNEQRSSLVRRNENRVNVESPGKLENSKFSMLAGGGSFRALAYVLDGGCMLPPSLHTTGAYHDPHNDRALQNMFFQCLCLLGLAGGVSLGGRGHSLVVSPHGQKSSYFSAVAFSVRLLDRSEGFNAHPSSRAR